MHQQHSVIEPDDNFETGTVFHLVAGNEGRVLDGRRTPGYIEYYDEESAMFIWRITGFEDAGKCWEIPAEQISSYQLRKGSRKLSSTDADAILKRCQQLNQEILIPKSEHSRIETENALTLREESTRDWILEKSNFYRAGASFDFAAKEGSFLLFEDMERYMKELGLYELEKETAEQYLLNPYSGEWIKGIKIVMAEMGLIAYSGTGPRKKDTFSGMGDKARRREYILARIAFLRSLFREKGYSEVSLFRGMSGEHDFYETKQTLVSTTFSANTAMEFADIKALTSRSTYFVKFACPVNDLFMTFFETRQFNERYKEQEAVIFYRGQVKF